ncbi:hypothetical protein PCANC_04300 [Puccinia coronata f. sp. avenae]|uniref:Integrase catalytic domain-containing protein n=1 Tax=Puccinia coronata f. sp. avenae TaxID=200324 RepID=A0A2N5VUM9_9BASI|nr:hypothetical protein PCANC_04300 [Puccinia coronata f. sp. avenae]
MAASNKNLDAAIQARFSGSVNPSKAATYAQSLLDKANAAMAKKALLSVNSGVADQQGIHPHPWHCHTLCTGRTTKEVLLIDLQTPRALSVKDPDQSYIDLHQALGHPSLTYLKKSFPNLSIPNIECSVCDVSKMHRQPFSGSFPIATKPLEIIHMDLCGPMSPPSWGGNFYFLKIINGYSKYHFIFPIKLKSNMFQTFSMFLSKVKNASGHKLISVVSDNSGEFVNNSFQSSFAAKGIKHLTSAPYTPQQNPFTKRGN